VKSTEIVDLIRQMRATFATRVDELVKHELSVKHSYDTGFVDRQNVLQVSTGNIEDFKMLGSKKASVKAAKEKQLAGETRDKSMDEKFQLELNTTCENRAAEFQQRSASQAAEIEAIHKAVEEIKKGVVPNYGENTKLVLTSTRLVQKHTASKGTPLKVLQFLQEATESNGDASRHKALDFLHSTAEKLNSAELLLLSMKARSDPFVRVRSLIKDLIDKLVAEATEDQTKTSFCDTATAAEQGTIQAAQAAIESKNADIASTEVDITTAKERIQALTAEIPQLQQALQNASLTRSQEHDASAASLINIDQGIASITNAVSILEAYYKASGLVQVSGSSSSAARYTPTNADRENKTVGDRAPEITWDGEYTGAAESTGVIGILQIILGDFERTKQATTDGEASAATSFSTFKTDTETLIIEKTGLVAETRDRVDELMVTLSTLKEDRATADATKTKAQENLRLLDCGNELNFGNRRAKREQEIEGLKQALRILVALPAN